MFLNVFCICMHRWLWSARTALGLLVGEFLYSLIYECACGCGVLGRLMGWLRLSFSEHILFVQRQLWSAWTVHGLLAGEIFSHCYLSKKRQLWSAQTADVLWVSVLSYSYLHKGGCWVLQRLMGCSQESFSSIPFEILYFYKGSCGVPRRLMGCSWERIL